MKRLVDSVFPPPVQNLNGAEMQQLKWSPEEVKLKKSDGLHSNGGELGKT